MSVNGTHNTTIMTADIPFSQEAEEAVIGAVIVNPEAYLAVAAFLKADDFYVLRNGLIWEACERISRRGDRIDYLTVTDELRTQKRLDDVGSAAYLTQCINSAPSSVYAETYGAIVQRAAIRRRYMLAASEIQRLARDETIPTETVESEVMKRLIGIQSVSSSGVVRISDAVNRHMARTSEAFENPREMLGIPSALPSVNKHTRGYRKGKFYVGAGRPGMGKSSWLLTEAAFMCGMKLRVFFGTLEMPEEEVVNNLIAAECMIAPDRLESGEMQEAEFSKYVRAAAVVDQWAMTIDDTGALTPQQLRLKCLRMKQESGLDAVFVDYVQLMMGGREIKYDNRDQEIGYISRSLKNLAKELDVPVIAAAQLSRAVENRQDKHPQLSDLRESGNIENDADMVMLFYRDDYYNPPAVPNAISPADLAIAKHRGGRTGMLHVGFWGEFKKFVEIDRKAG